MNRQTIDEWLEMKRQAASLKFAAQQRASYAHYAKHGHCAHDLPAEPEPEPIDPWLAIAAEATPEE